MAITQKALTRRRPAVGQCAEERCRSVEARGPGEMSKAAAKPLLRDYLRQHMPRAIGRERRFQHRDREFHLDAARHRSPR
jgi:hypothetical protein